ncbi:MAG: metal ABC transporter solute-binding protein, Zn/Mn family [Thermoplasmata archaeon]
MKRSLQVGIALVGAVIIVAAGAYEVLSSSNGANPCASTDPTTSNSTPSQASPFQSAVTAVPLVMSAPAGSPLPHGSRAAASAGPIEVVAAENFWGSLVSQLGGNHTSVLSIVDDPNSDPHEYEANSSDAVAISDAQLVIVNGVGYDDWALQLISADNNPSQVVLNVGDLNGVSVSGGIVTGNPHLWYNPVYVNRTVAAMYSDLVSIRPSAAADFQADYATLNSSLAELYGRATEIRSDFAGTEVASTESIFVYLANFTRLDLVSPPAFMEAIAEGNDPPAQSVVEFQCQLESGHVKVLVFNEQTVTPITTNMKAIAAAHNVTAVGVTETIQPPGVSFQVWMNAQYLQLQNALNADELGQ